MKIDFNVSVTDLDGKPIAVNEKAEEFLNLGKQFASILSQSNSTDPIKVYECAIKVNKGEVVDFDTSDQEFFKKIVMDAQVRTLLKAQLLLKFKKSQ